MPTPDRKCETSEVFETSEVLLYADLLTEAKVADLLRWPPPCGGHRLFFKAAMNPKISFRAIEDADLEFLYEVYADSRAEELAVVPWSDEEKEEFLRMQFRAQHEFYQQNYSQAVFQIILVDGQPAGRLYVERRTDEHRIMDIALLTSQRGRAIGGQIMRDLLEEAAAAGKPVTIHVAKENRALHLYDRLGFREIGSTEVYLLMEWKPTH